MKNVLFLCTGNSARSVMAEAILDRLGQGRFRALSAGSHPTGRVNPLALDALGRMGIEAQQARSKSWDEFAAPGAPRIDIVITVCDSAANETCPVWPGRPVSAHWGVEDPAAVQGTDAQKRAAFEHAAAILKSRIERLVALPVETLDAPQLRARLREIGAGA